MAHLNKNQLGTYASDNMLKEVISIATRYL